MAKFFFDFHDNGRAVIDSEGTDIESRDRALAEARLTLRDAVADATISRDAGSISVVVRDQNDRPVIRATVDWNVWVEEDAN